MDKELADLISRSHTRPLSIFDAQNAGMLGYCIALFYLRARCADLSNPKYDVDLDLIEEEDFSFGYVTLRTDCAFIKNMQAADPFSGIAHFVGHSHSIDGRTWAVNFIEARRLAGLSSAHDEYLMRVPLFDGTFGDAMIVASGATQWLRVYLHSHNVPFEEYIKVSSHSCKFGCLTMCARAELSEQHRRVLGCHRYAMSRSVRSYSRDDYISPLRPLGAFLSPTVGKKFFS